MIDYVPERPGWWGRRWIVCTRYADPGFERSYGCSGDRMFWTRSGAESEQAMRRINQTETTGKVRHTVIHR